VSISLPLPPVLTLNSSGPGMARGYVNGIALGSDYLGWFEFQTSPALLESNPFSLFAEQFYGSGSDQTMYEQPLYDTNCWGTAQVCLNAGQTLYYRIVVEDTLGNLMRGSIETAVSPELTLLAPTSGTVCNGDPLGAGDPQPCPVNPPTATVEAVSTGPSGTYQNPFSNVEFRYGTTYGSLGSTTLTVTDDGVTRTFHYTATFSGSNLPPGNEAVWVVGYGSPGDAPIYGGFLTISIAID
jgi:hypothetical protein